ncbi:MAG: CoA ester lyase [Alcaligenaceae bacterium]|nr:CoA ester lyase [Alcaligenaceae bacterium]
MTMQARSYLFVPGNRPERFDKACASGADAVILDLEDAVGSDSKDKAREEIRQWIEQGNQAYIRINAANTKWFVDDCSLLALKGVLGVMLPKAERKEDIQKLEQLKHDDCQILLLIETAKGLYQAAELAQLPCVSRLAFGSVDFQLDCSIPNSDFALDYARSALVVASAVGGLPSPIDGVTVSLDDVDLIRGDSEKSKSLGFSAKLCIHPNQITIVNQAFLPTDKEVQQAQRIVEAVTSASDVSAARLDGKLLEKPIVIWAERILALNEQHQ